MSFPRGPHRLLLALSLIVVTTACSRSQDSTGAQRAPIPVTVATVTQKPVPVQLRAIGNVVPTETATVRSRVGGILTAVEFKEGQDVKQGQLLFTIDRRPLEEQLRQAQANLAKSTTQLENAQKQASRYAELVEQGFVAQEQYDQLRTTALAAQATANADRAAVENARLQLEWASIRAPISGRTGALAAHEGDLVVPNTTALVVINELQPVDVAFALPERALTDVQRYRSAGPLEVDVADASGRTIARGELAFIDNRVDPTTGTIQLKGRFANDPVTLWPGQYVSAVLTLTTDPAAVVVPTIAVQTSQQGRFVYVVKPDGHVDSRPVTVAREVGGESVIADGVRPGESVVTEGQLRLTPGALVEVKSPGSAEGSASPR